MLTGSTESTARGDLRRDFEQNLVALSFGLCLVLEVLPLEGDLLFSLSTFVSTARLIATKLAITALILLPLSVAWLRGSTIGRLLGYRRVLFTLAVTGIWAGLHLWIGFAALEKGTLWTIPSR